MKKILALLLVLLLLSSCAAPAPTAVESVSPATEPAPPVSESEPVTSCTLIIDCSTLLSRLDELPEGKAELVPKDGILLETVTEFIEGESVFDITLRELRAAKAHFEFSESPVFESAYVEGIYNLYEFDCGALSGWLFRINGGEPGYGCSVVYPEDGDRIEWLFTCDMGDDL
jgi:hypothetical protein